MTIRMEFTRYLSRMLGRDLAADETLTLSSGQQARAAGWLAERGFAPGDLRSRLGGRFTPAGILGEAAIAGYGNGNGNGSALPHGSPEAAPARGPMRHAESGGRLGIDMQRVHELIPADALADPKSSAELTAMFTLREISYAQSRPSPAETLCGLFCAKEALRKCDPALLRLPLTALEILPDEAGRPHFPGYSLSISHSGGFAIAVALGGAAAQAPPAGH